MVEISLRNIDPQSATDPPLSKGHTAIESVGRAETDLHGDRVSSRAAGQTARGRGAGALGLGRSTSENKPEKKSPLLFVTAISATHQTSKRLEFQLAKLVLVKVNLNSQGGWKKWAGQRKTEGPEESTRSQFRSSKPKGLLVEVFPRNGRSI